MLRKFLEFYKVRNKVKVEACRYNAAVKENNKTINNKKWWTIIYTENVELGSW